VATTTLPDLSGLSVSSSGAPVYSGITDNYAWATALLANLGPSYVTQNNVNNVVAWMASEEPVSNWTHNNNPLNINLGGTGSDTFPSLDAAAKESARWVGTMSNYTAIKAALASNAPYETFKSAVVMSPWAGGHYAATSGGPWGAAFASTGQPIVNATGQTLNQPSTVNPATGTTPGTCGAKGGGINIFSVSILNACQIKALTGGLLVAAGGLTMGVGVIVLVAYGLTNTRIGQVATQAATKGPTGTIIKGVGGAAKKGWAATGSAGLEARQAARDEEMYAEFERNKPEIDARNKRYRAEQKKAERAGYSRAA